MSQEQMLEEQVFSFLDRNQSQAEDDVLIGAIANNFEVELPAAQNMYTAWVEHIYFDRENICSFKESLV